MYVDIENIFKNFISIYYKQYYNFFLLINFNKIKKNKTLFFFILFFNSNRYRFLNKYNAFSYYENIKNLINKSFLKTINFNMFFFNLKKNKYNQILNFTKKIIKIKLLIILKNFILIIFFNYIVV